MYTGGAVALALVLLLLAAGAGWIIFTRIRASRLGLPPPPWKSYIPFLSSSSTSSSSYGGGGGPSPAPGGIIGWFNDRIRLMRHRGGNTRTAAGAYEGSSSSGAYNAGYATTGNSGSRGFDHLEDDPWDSRVGGYNPYEEERELGLVPPAAGGHGYRPDGEGYQMNLAVAPGGSGAGGGGEGDEERRGRPRSRSPGPQAKKGNPFGDEAEPSNLSLRGVSPRPMEPADTSFAGRKAAKEDHDRRSMFREEV
ncbi:hypothetical protein C8A01DRAFT_34045 [Parachaetomium inaequale]|uniref:Acid phosphatase-like protein n=1 Tax=Parachaetomium inaequale TaxID=2588326 RepID=A0AAN6PNV9_9PEZI|nr:hypothetical protein C8A01DRAFT_34045 [Parachaetomium inaequale]